MRAIAVVMTLALAGCGGEAAEPAAELVPAPAAVEVPPASPALTDADRNKINSYAAGTIISCGTAVAIQGIRQMGGSADGSPPVPASIMDVRSMHAALVDFPTAQEALKDLRSAETECIRLASSGMDQRVRAASVTLRTELEMIPGP